MALIDQLRAELGFASLLISHNLPLVAAHCQRIGVLRDGRAASRRGRPPRCCSRRGTPTPGR